MAKDLEFSLFSAKEHRADPEMLQVSPLIKSSGIARAFWKGYFPLHHQLIPIRNRIGSFPKRADLSGHRIRLSLRPYFLALQIKREPGLAERLFGIDFGDDHSPEKNSSGGLLGKSADIAGEYRKQLEFM